MTSQLIRRGSLRGKHDTSIDLGTWSPEGAGLTKKGCSLDKTKISNNLVTRTKGESPRWSQRDAGGSLARLDRTGYAQPIG